MKCSNSTTQISAALAAAQGEMGTAKKTADNPYFKSRYADLASCIEATRGALSAHGLAVVQTADCDGDLAIVETRLTHTSGEYFESRTVLKPVKADPQGMGSAVTYARRYAYMAIVGLAAEDDDGNAASRPADGQVTTEAMRPTARQTSTVQTDAKRKAYFANMAKLGIDGETAKNAVKERFDLEHFNDATLEQLRQVYEAAKKVSEAA